MGGAVYFQEIRSFSEFQAFMFVLGILTTIGGVALLAQRSLNAAPPLLKKRKTMAMRNLSSYWHNPKALAKEATMPPPISEDTVAVDAVEAGTQDANTAAQVANDVEREPVTTQDSDDDADPSAAASRTGATTSTDEEEEEDANSMNRQAIENSLDISPMGTFLMGYPAQRNLGIFLRRESSNRLASAVLRPNQPRSTQDDFEIGLPTTSDATQAAAASASTDAASGEDKKKAKRRSITFAGFKSSK